jgi:UrcA family protein
MKSIVAIFGAVVLSASAAATAAESVTVTAPAPSARVSYADLNLDTDSGRAQLQRRIRGAARDLCLEDNIGSLKARLQRQACFTAAVADGYRQLDALLDARASGTAFAAATLAFSAR